MTERNWMHCIDAPTLRATSRVDQELFKLKEKTFQRQAIIDKRWDWLQDAVRPVYEAEEAGEEETPRDKQLLALCARAERHSEELGWRIKQINKAMTIMEEIGEFVTEVSIKPERSKRIKVAKAAAKVQA